MSLQRLALAALVALGLVLALPLAAAAQSPITALDGAVTRTSTATTRSAVAAVEVSGTYSGTLAFEVLGTTWTAVSCVLASDGTTRATTTTTTGKWVCPIAGWKAVRVRASLWTSGSAVVYVGLGAP